MCPHKENEEEGLDVDRLEDSHLTVEAEVGVMELQAKEPENPQQQTDEERQKEQQLGASRRCQHCLTPLS